MAKYGKKASSSVKRAVKKKKGRNAYEWEIGQESNKSETGDCDWPFRGSANGSEGSKKERI